MTYKSEPWRGHGPFPWNSYRPFVEEFKGGTIYFTVLSKKDHSEHFCILRNPEADNSATIARAIDIITQSPHDLWLLFAGTRLFGRWMEHEPIYDPEYDDPRALLINLRLFSQ